jgi:hypothetical protein
MSLTKDLMFLTRKKTVISSTDSNFRTLNNLSIFLFVVEGVMNKRALCPRISLISVSLSVAGEYAASRKKGEKQKAEVTTPGERRGRKGGR